MGKILPKHKKFKAKIRKFNKEQLYDLCFSPFIIMMIIYQGVCNGRGLGQKGMQKLFEFGKCLQKRPLGMEDNKMQLK